MRRWRIEDSAELYNINGWGLKYFSINEKGHIQVTPREGYAGVDLKDVMDELQVRDITAPILLRFPDILDNRIEKISNCFKSASNEYNYTAERTFGKHPVFLQISLFCHSFPLVPAKMQSLQISPQNSSVVSYIN